MSFLDLCGSFLIIAAHIGEQQLNPVAFCIESPIHSDSASAGRDVAEPVLHLCNRNMDSILFQLSDLGCILLNFRVKPRSFYRTTLTAGLCGG